MEELSIKVNIADRFYPLTIQSADEEMVRKAAKLINDKLKELQHQFSVKDKQDMLSMISLELAVETLRLKDKNEKDDSEITDRLQRITALLQEVSI